MSQSSEARVLPIPALVRLCDQVGLGGTLFKDQAMCFQADFPVSVDLGLCLAPASSFPPLCLLLCNLPTEIPSFSPKYQTPLSFYLFTSVTHYRVCMCP